MQRLVDLEMAEAYQLGSALEGLTGADLAYQQRWQLPYHGGLPPLTRRMR